MTLGGTHNWVHFYSDGTLWATDDITMAASPCAADLLQACASIYGAVLYNLRVGWLVGGAPSPWRSGVNLQVQHLLYCTGGTGLVSLELVPGADHVTRHGRVSLRSLVQEINLPQLSHAAGDSIQYTGTKCERPRMSDCRGIQTRIGCRDSEVLCGPEVMRDGRSLAHTEIRSQSGAKCCLDW